MRCSRSGASGSTATRIVWQEIASSGSTSHARARRGAGPDRRVRGRQVDHRPRSPGLCAARVPDHRRLRGLRRHRPAPSSASREAQDLGARIAYVAQSAAAAFNPAHRLIDQYPRRGQPRAHDPARGRGDRSFASSGCPSPSDFGERYPHQVSGGQLQRAMTAMAMSCKPDLIVFDEPTTALDVTTQIEVLAAIKDVVRELAPRRSTSPTTSRWWRRWPTGSWSCARRGWSRRAPPRQILSCPDEHPTLVNGAGSRRRWQQGPQPGAEVLLRVERRRGLRQLPGAARRQPRGAAAADGGGGRRVRLRQVDARPRDLRPPAAERGEISSAASSCRRRSRPAARTCCAGCR